MTQVLAVSTQPRSWYCIEPLVAGIAPLIQSTHTHKEEKKKEKKNSRSSNPLDARQPPSIYHHRGSGGSFPFLRNFDSFVHSEWLFTIDSSSRSFVSCALLSVITNTHSPSSAAADVLQLLQRKTLHSPNSSLMKSDGLVWTWRVK